jgi:hypothetical protein
MKKDSVPIILITLWQFLWAIFALCILVIRIKDTSFWSDTTWGSILELDTSIIIGWRVVSIFSMVFPIFAIIGCIGLIAKRNWGHKLSILSMGIITVFLIFIVVLLIFSLQNEPIIENFFIEVAPVVLLILALLFCSICSLIFLIKPRVKELFMGKPTQA